MALLAFLTRPVVKASFEARLEMPSVLLLVCRVPVMLNLCDNGAILPELSSMVGIFTQMWEKRGLICGNRKGRRFEVIENNVIEHFLTANP